MCPKNLALDHPAAPELLKYATGGCPCNTGKPWSKEMISEAVERGPHHTFQLSIQMQLSNYELKLRKKRGWGNVKWSCGMI
jgi:hypothetical protein